MSNNRRSDPNSRMDADNPYQRPPREYEYPEDVEEAVPSARRRRSQRREREYAEIDDRATRVARPSGSYTDQENSYAAAPPRRTGRSSPPSAYEDEGGYPEEMPRRQGRPPRNRTAAHVQEEILDAEAPRRASRSGRGRASEYAGDYAEEAPPRRAGRGRAPEYEDDYPEEEPPRRSGRTRVPEYEDDYPEEEPPRRGGRGRRDTYDEEPREAPRRSGRGRAADSYSEDRYDEPPARGRSGGRGRDDYYDDDPPHPTPRYRKGGRYEDDPYDDRYDDYDEEPYEEDHRPRRGLWVVLIIVVVLVLAGVGLSFLFPEIRDEVFVKAGSFIQGLMGGDNEEAELAALHIDSFTVDDQVADVGEQMVFTLTTNNEVSRVRLQDATGNLLAEHPNVTDGAQVFQDGDMLLWTLPVTFDAPYSGVVDAMAGTETAWADQAFFSLDIQVADGEEPEATPAVMEIEETPAPTLASTPTPEPTPEPTPTPVPYVVSAASPIAEALPEAMNLTSYIVKDGEKSETLARAEPVSMGDPDTYAAQSGVLTFRSGPMRQNAAFGTVDIVDKKMEILWSNRTGAVDEHTGIAFPGQPLIVKWHKEIREMMNIEAEKKNITALKEVIFAAMDGKIYFYDLDDGSATRDPIDIGYPLRGTPSVDPRGYPILYAGQSISKLKDNTGTIGLRVFSLIDQTPLYLESGRNKNAPLPNYGAVDGSPVLEKTSDTLIYAGENGLLYTMHLGTNFNYETGELSVSPNTIAYGYEVSKKKEVSIEASVAVYGNYAYIVDGEGTLQCVDMNTMTSVWVADVTDNTDSTAALEIEEDGSVALYTACSVLNQTGKGKAAWMRKFDALSGRLIWEVEMAAKAEKKEAGGVMASPIVGENNINDLVIFTVTNVEDDEDKDAKAKVVALDKSSGDLVWQEILDASTWSSPVAVYASDRTSYIIQGDDTGKLRLMDGFTGSTEFELQLEGAIQGSPAVYENMLVVGTTDSRMYGVRLQ